MLASPESYRLGEHHLYYNPAISPAYDLKIDFTQHRIDDPHRCSSNDEDEDDNDNDGLSEGILSALSVPEDQKPGTVVGEDMNDEEDLIMFYYGEAEEHNQDQQQQAVQSVSPRSSNGEDKISPAVAAAATAAAAATTTKKPFDLAAFAQALYDTRLSVIEDYGDDGPLLREKDEQEYVKLMTLRRKSKALRHLLEVAEDEKVELTLAQTPQEAEEEDITTTTTTTVISSPTQSSSNLSRSSRFKELFDVDLCKFQPTPTGDTLAGTDEAAIGAVITKDPRRAKATRSLGLFGSLRQVTNRKRSQSASNIICLMKSLSTGRKRSSSSSSSSTGGGGSRSSNSSSRNSATANSTTPQISPAGLATLQHPVTTNDRPQQRQSEEAVGNNKRIRLLSQLVGRMKRTTSLTRRQTKKINMRGCGDDERSRLVRRTIIYVQPDSENFFKTLGQLEEEEHQQPTVTRRSCADNTSTSTSTSTSSRQPLEGVEMREMSDGSVTWGIIKKQGNRKSFFDPRESKCEINDEGDEDDETEEQIEERVLALMGLRPDFLKDFQPHPPPHSLHASSLPPPIPTRSPFRYQQEQQQQQQQQATHIHTTLNQRDASTTDIYYAPNATLPSLLQMISMQNEKIKEIPSVEEQLDEVIRSFSSCDYL